jgi:DNA-binding transcriptional MerR regulator
MTTQSAALPVEALSEETQAPESEAAKSKKSATAFRTISEVAEDLDVPQHVLRFWETKFSQVRPLKRGGGRRYYRPEDVELIKTIHHLLYTEGYTIKGVQKLLKERGKSKVVQNNRPAAQPKSVTPATVAANTALSEKNRGLLESMLGELKELRRIVSAE